MNLSDRQKRLIWSEIFILIGAFFLTNQIIDWIDFSRDLDQNPNPFMLDFSSENSKTSLFAFAKGWPTFLFFSLIILGQGLIYKFREEIFHKKRRIDK